MKEFSNPHMTDFIDYSDIGKDIPVHLLDGLIQTPDYSTPSRRKRLLERVFFEARSGSLQLSRAWLDANIGRQKKVILQSIEKVASEFSSLELHSLEESFINSEAFCKTDYVTLDDIENYTLASAIWILDNLRLTNRLKDAYQYLPESSADIWDVWIPTDFYHPCYDMELLQSVMHTICLSNSLGDEAENFRGLMSLIDPDRIQTAVDKFHALQWQAIGAYLKGEQYFDRETRDFAMEMKSLSASNVMVLQNDTLENRKRDLAKRFMDTQDDRMHFHTLFDYSFGRCIRKVFGIRELGRALDAEIGDPYELCFALTYLIGTDDDSIWLMHAGTVAARAVCRRLPWRGNPEGKDPEYGYGFDEWDEEEPEELTFDGNAWLERQPPAEKVDIYQIGKNGKDNIAQQIYQLCRGVVPTGMHPFELERQTMKNEGNENADFIADWSEILFLSSFQASAANLNRSNWYWDPDEEADDEDDDVLDNRSDENAVEKDDSGEGKDIARIVASPDTDTTPSPSRTSEKLFLGLSSSGDLGGRHAEQIIPDESGYEDELRKTRMELEKARRQIKGLQKALVESRRDADTERAKTERELNALRMEHRELADLRELVFNQENDVREKPTKEIQYPYETRKRTVVFGGHDTFLKAFRPLLPTVKYVDTAIYSFSPEIVRNADVVWIQNNCISHSQYGNIVRLTRQHGIQLRYFAYASAEKCAEQLVIEDQKE